MKEARRTEAIVKGGEKSMVRWRDSKMVGSKRWRVKDAWWAIWEEKGEWWLEAGDWLEVGWRLVGGWR